MKKTYISPKNILADMMPETMIALSGHDEAGDGNQLTKEYAGDNSSAGTSGKSIWDNEW
ncbi:MAG: hypothetical protein J6V92_01805 [Bacteroidaceae bacterium]|nr:hypothetical protein [Bacteroidaceae bacterium]